MPGDRTPIATATVRSAHVSERARIVQDFLEIPLALENVSSYLGYRVSTMSECDFLSRVVKEADCGILLDVNNVYVSAFNHDFDPKQYLEALPHHRVLQYHLAGHSHKGKYILDTHSDFVVDAVWDLYRHACQLTGPVSTLIEWDENIPSFETLLGEAQKARRIREEVERERAA